MRIYDKIIKDMKNKESNPKKKIRIIGFTYIICMLIIVALLNNFAKDGKVPFALSNTFYDIYIFTVGILIYAMMPLRIQISFKKIAIVSLTLSLGFLIGAPCLKYIASGQQVLADIFYLFSGAMLYQGIMCIKMYKKLKNSILEEKDNEYMA